MGSNRTYAACLVVAGILLALSTGGCGDAGGARAGEPPAGWTTHRDARRGLSIDLPPGWHRARESLTPDLADPREILSVGSYPLRYSAKARCHVPGCPLPAIDDFGPTDVLVSIQERGASDSVGSVGVPRARMVAGYPPRPRPFTVDPMDLRYAPSERRHCARLRIGAASFTPFRDAGRAFYAFVAIGRSASERTRRDALRLLDTLRFTPAPVAGRRSR
jgi:hypothetical protein